MAADPDRSGRIVAAVEHVYVDTLDLGADPLTLGDGAEPALEPGPADFAEWPMTAEQAAPFVPKEIG